MKKRSLCSKPLFLCVLTHWSLSYNLTLKMAWQAWNLIVLLKHYWLDSYLLVLLWRDVRANACKQDIIALKTTKTPRDIYCANRHFFLY